MADLYSAEVQCNPLNTKHVLCNINSLLTRDGNLKLFHYLNNMFVFFPRLR